MAVGACPRGADEGENVLVHPRKRIKKRAILRLTWTLRSGWLYYCCSRGIFGGVFSYYALLHIQRGESTRINGLKPLPTRKLGHGWKIGCVTVFLTQ
jgi:hypothetical protein